MRNDQPAAMQRNRWLRIGPFTTRNRAGARQMAKFERARLQKQLQTVLII